MTLSDPRLSFGVYSVAPYNPTTGLPYGILKVLENSSFNLTGEQIELRGGALKYPWGVEPGDITAELSLQLSEYPDFIFELFLGKAPTANVAEASGNISTITDQSGTSVVDASTGIASIAAIAGSEADLKFGKYIVKAVSATTVDIYALTDIDFTRGTDKEFVNDGLKITAAPLTVTSGADTNVTGFGFKIVGGAGVIAMVSGNTATFEVRPINSKSMTVTVGATTDVFPEFGAIVMAAQKSNGELFELDIFKLVGSGMPFGFTRKTWSQSSITAKAFYSSSKNGIFKARNVSPT